MRAIKKRREVERRRARQFKSASPGADFSGNHRQKVWRTGGTFEPIGEYELGETWRANARVKSMTCVLSDTRFEF